MPLCVGSTGPRFEELRAAVAEPAEREREREREGGPVTDSYRLDETVEVLDANSDGMLDRDELPSIHGPAGPDHWPADPNQPAEQGAKAGKAGRGGDERASEQGDLAARTRRQWSLGHLCDLERISSDHLILSMREARIARARGV